MEGYKSQLEKAYMDQSAVQRIIASQQNHIISGTVNKAAIASIRVESIENGYLVIYSKPGVAEKRKFAPTMANVGDVTIAACTELMLTTQSEK